MIRLDNSFDTRLKRLEEIQNTFERAEKYYGDFAVESAGNEMILNRSHDEPWGAFKARLNQLAFEHQRSPLRIIFFFPTTTEREAENA